MRRVTTVAVLLAVVLALAPAPSAAAATPCSKGNVALTFDDGPRAGTTVGLLDHLKRRRVPSTFFVVGQNVVRYPSTIRRMARERHVIANHTWSHPNLRTLSYSGVRQQILRTHKALGDLGVPRAKLVRPPYGATNSTVRAAIESLGMREALWTVDSDDWRTGRSAKSISDRVLSRLHRDAVVLLHDGVGNSHNTVRAVPRIVDTARARGYCFGVLNDRNRVVPLNPRISIHNTRVIEGGAGTKTAADFKITFDYPTSNPVSFNVVTEDGSAKAGEDYRARSERITVAPGRTTKLFRVVVKGDDDRERDEVFRVRLSRARNGVIADGVAKAVIVNDDARG
jgi:peptidoglycan/xylan/chitin deacetylase (PgdA/CDA1 family)